MDKPRRITGEILKHEQRIAEHITQKEKLREKDSRLQPWGVYDAPLSNVEGTFIPVLIKARDVPVHIQELLEQKFGNRVGTLRGIELGGPGSRLFFELNDGGKNRIFSKSLGVTLNDLRPPGIKSLDDRQGHKVIEGDIFAEADETAGAYAKVSEWLNGEKADFMVERMLLGLERYNKLKLEFFYLKLKNWYKQLKEGGIMLVELPVPQEDAGAAHFQNIVEGWVKFLKREHSAELKAESEFWKIPELNDHMAALYLEKIKDIPLPRNKDIPETPKIWQKYIKE